MKRQNKAARADRLLKTVLLASAVLLIAALIYTIFFRFSADNLLLVLVLMACIGVCIPAYWPMPKKGRKKGS